MQASSVFAASRCCDRCSSIVSALLALLLAATTSSVGCSQKQRELAPLTGKVIYNGEPLQFGTVMIEHKYGQPATAVIQPDGTFVMATRGEGDGTAAGTSRIRIACYEGQNPAKEPSLDEPAVLGKSLIPEKYTSFETSGLTVEVRLGTNEPVVLNLSGGGKSRSSDK